MPMYEYQCETCGKVFELIQRFSDAPLQVHEDCGGPVHRLVSAPALQFKGSGWYVTDYAKQSSKPAGDSKPAATETKSDGKAETKTDGKPAATTTSTKTSE
jgi:putative FmdB family regulatory protein